MLSADKTIGVALIYIRKAFVERYQRFMIVGCPGLNGAEKSTEEGWASFSLPITERGIPGSPLSLTSRKAHSSDRAVRSCSWLADSLGACVGWVSTGLDVEGREKRPNSSAAWRRL